MKYIFGLGNPGEKYLKSRHNCGYLFIDWLVNETGITETFNQKNESKALICETIIRGEKVLLIKPTTFMNLSGECIAKILSYYKGKTEDCVVVYDDIDLPLGAYRFRKEGSAGTHNGMKSIITTLGTNAIPRLRIGIENRETIQKANQPLSDYVLQNFSSSEISNLKECFNEAVDEIYNYLLG